LSLLRLSLNTQHPNRRLAQVCSGGPRPPGPATGSSAVPSPGSEETGRELLQPRGGDVRSSGDGLGRKGRWAPRGGAVSRAADG